MTDKQKSLIFEFMRYVVVGGVAFLADAGTMALVKELFFKDDCTAWQMALCVAAGFVVGLAVNYLLSNWFVFRSAAQREKGQNVGAFLIYAVVGLIGFGITELLMWLGVMAVGPDGLWYLAIKCVVAGIVLIWNYIGRKIFVYKGE